MLFMAEMTVRIPSTLAPEVADEIKRKERSIRSSCSGTASGATCGASSANTPT